MLSKVRIKDIQSLGQKKFRQERGVFIAEGPKVVEELLLAQKAHILEVLALPEWIESHRSLFGDIPVTAISVPELEKISQLSTPNQVLAIVRQFEPGGITTGKELILLLDGIRDPGNLGTIIRIADWFGLKRILCSEDCADCYNPKVVQATMGSIARVEVRYVSPVDWLQQHTDLPVYAAALEGRPLKDIGIITEGVLIIGNESKGIGPELLSLAGTHITIPRKGGAESLNAAVATGIILSHLA